MNALIPMPRSADRPSPQQHDDFLPLASVVARHAKVVFRGIPASHREEKIAEAVASALQSFVRLKARGQKPAEDFPSMMAHYAVLHVKNGRQVGSRSSSRDVLSFATQRKRGFRIESLPSSCNRTHDQLHGSPHGQSDLDRWEDQFQDGRCWPIPDQVAFKLDFAAFLRSLSPRDRRIVRFLALGHSGQEAAQKFNLSPGRMSQLRHQWCREWHLAQGQESPV
ncbi:hypothetical protein AYO44_05160 [Planctomycetaceae bacterium SCGC AG-212-F19]|nr:hypothetical protein AYO44_05160 [Planctomycetaceae bacterium SCGC AG-212-F19]